MTDRSLHGNFETNEWRYIDSGEPYYAGITGPLAKEMQRHLFRTNSDTCACGATLPVDPLTKKIAHIYVQEHLANSVSALVNKMIADAYNQGVDDYSKHLTDKLNGHPTERPHREIT